MAQRLNKKLLLGLGSGIGFLTTGVISGFGIRAIANQGIDNFNQTNRLAEQAFTQAPDYNVATPNMFIDTTNLKNFHFGNTQIGQTVTPYGWLGVFEDSRTVQNRIALTSWSGEILWVNEDYKNETTDQFNVYDMKYDFNSDLIFVIRTNSPNGMFTPTGGLAPLRLDVLDAKTGKNVYDQLNKDYWVSNIQNRAKTRFQQIFFDNNNPTANDWLANRDRWQNLFYLDIASRPGTNKVVVSYIPKFTQMVQKRRLSGEVDPITGAPASNFISNDKEIQLISVKDFVDSWRETVLSIHFFLDSSNKPTGHSTKRYWLRKSRRINAKTEDWLIDSVNNVWVSMADYFLIANPFITIGNRGNIIIHFIAANTNNDVWHKTIGFPTNGSGEDNTIPSADILQNITRTNLFNLSSEPNFKKTWGYANRWNPLFANANLIPNRNMFDNNSIVIAYPYASNENVAPNSGRGLPAFNVEQLLIDDREDSGVLIFDADPNSKNPKQSWNYTFGKDIADNYNHRGGSFYPSGNVNGPYPWPLGKNININTANIDRQYNRLLTVSPFDNTIVYAAKANLNLSELIIQEANRDKSVGLWIANRNNFNLNQGQKRFARPFLIPNWTQGDAASPIDLQMTNPKSLYIDGVTFDILSLQSQNNGTAKLNLYFNHTGSGRNDSYNNNKLLTSKIGLLDDVLSKDPNLWTENIANLSTLSGTDTENLKKISSKITNNSYATLIHSRANLETWFARTWLNNTAPTNLYANNYQLNAGENLNNRAVATSFGQSLRTAEFNKQDSVDLVSHWQDKNNANPPNYNRLAIKRPKILVKGSVDRKLPIETTYNLVNNGIDFFNKPGWGISQNNLNRIIYKTNQEITNASYQIFSSWKEQIRIDAISPNNATTTTDNLKIRESHTFKQQPQWYDARKPGAQANPFGKINNELPINNINPLRLVLQIAKPKGTLPAWFKTINENRFFNTKYPLAKDALQGESTFEEIVQSFLAEKARKIDLSQNNDNVAVGFGNLKIDAYLDLNPRVINNATVNNSKIFTNGGKRILTLADGQRIIYEDLYSELYHEIYDQSAINYPDFNRWGFGNNNDVRNRVQTSWTSNIPRPGTKINTSIDYSLLADKLVRTDRGNIDNVFDFDYAKNSTNQLELTPTNVDWFKNHFFNFNRLINLFVQFEYQTAGQTDPNRWNNLGTFYNDQQLMAAYDNTNNKLVLRTGVVPNINKLRFRLTTKGANAVNDVNHFVDLKKFNPSDPKYTSKNHLINVQPVIVNNNWFNEVFLTSNDILQNISLNAFKTYEEIIIAKSPSIQQNSALRTKIKLVYQWPGTKDWIDAQEMINLIKGKLIFPAGQWNTTDQGVFALNDGKSNPGGILIKTKFEIADPNANIKFVNNGGTEITGNALTGNLKANIQTKVDLGIWLNELNNKKIVGHQGNRPGVLTDFEIPGKDGNLGQNQFSGKSYNEIKQILNNVGIKIRFKKWINNTWSDWLENENQVDAYDPSNPQLVIGFSNANSNISLKNNNSDIVSDQEFILKLNIPKLIKLPNNIDDMIAKFNQANVFSGNTFNLNVNNLANGHLAIVNTLIQSSATANTQNEYDKLKQEGNLVLKFKLANANNDWLEANQLQAFLKTQSTIDQPSNALKLKVELSTSIANEFVLATDLANQEFNLLIDNNLIIKKWIHGTDYEQALGQRTAIVLKAGSNKNKLQYLYDPKLEPLFNNSGREGLVVQWRLGSNSNQWNNLKNGNNLLPSQVNSTENFIKIRVAQDPDNQVYLYGPQEQDQQTEFTLDLSQIPVPIQISNNWFSEIFLRVPTNQFLQNITAQSFIDYENEFFQKSPSLNSNNNDLRAKIKLQFQFNKTGAWLEAAQIATIIKNKLNNFNASDQGIWVLSHDGQTFNGNNNYSKSVFVINARVTTVQINDPTIQFVDLANPDQQINNNQLEGNLKSNIKTKVDLSAWFNEIQRQGVNATKAAQSGQLDGNSIRIPGKSGSPGSAQLAGKTFAQIETILNKVNLFFQYKKYDFQNNSWSEWLEHSGQIDSYNPQNPQIVLGLKSGNNNSNNADLQALNVDVFNNGTLFNSDSEWIVKLNVPKLVKNPTNIDETIEKFNQQNPFGGNTFNLTLDPAKLKAAEKQLVNDIKLASEEEASQFDNLEAVLEFKYKLGNSAWNTAENLKNFLATQSSDQNSNELKIKVELKSITSNSEFELDTNGIWEYTLQKDNNSKIKKYLHGTDIEADLTANKISATGSKNSLQYSFQDSLAVFNPSGIDSTRELTLQYRLLDGNNNPFNNLNWTNGYLPTSVDVAVQKIQIRIGHDPSYAIDQAIFVYGPESQKNQAIATVDLSQIAILIQIDQSWLEADQLVTSRIDSKNISVAMVQAWEDKIWQRIPEASNSEIKQKMVIKYDFKNYTGLTAANLFDVINEEINKYNDSTHHGIVKLHDKTVPGPINGFTVKAIIEKAKANDQSIQFVNPQGNVIDGDDNKNQRSGIVNTSQITTTLDLSAWIKNLIDQKTVVNAPNAGIIDSLTPPILNQPPTNNLFAGQTFNNIENWLKPAQIKFWWNNELNGNNWQSTEQIKNYDPVKGQLWFAIENQSSNLILKLGNQINDLTPGTDNKKQPITITLDAPRIINVLPTDAQSMQTMFSGNTKYLQVDTQGIKNELRKLLERQGTEFVNAPLTLMVRVGTEAFVDYKNLAQVLSTKTTDLESSLVTVKFAIDQNAPNANKFELGANGADEFTLISDQRIKIFINDQGIYENLKSKTKLKGLDNTNFQFDWPNNWIVDQNGLLNAGNKGKGLRLEFSFADLPENQSSGTNIDKQWVETLPSSYALDKKQIYIRLQTQTNYVYENIVLNKPYKFNLPLNLPQVIQLDGNWLNQPFSAKAIQLDQLGVNNFDSYETLVKQQIKLPDEIKEKVAIKYSFDGKNNLNKADLINEINNYQKNFNDQGKNFGFLQLWNGVQGVKISAFFAKSNEADQTYRLDIANQNQYDLDLSQVITIIDLSLILEWLQTIKVNVVPNANIDNGIKTLIFPSINVNNEPHFNGKTWNQFKTVLANLGLKLQFRALTQANINQDESDWVDEQNGLNIYDPAIGKIQIRFKFESQKGSNLKAKLDATTIIDGFQTKPSKPFDIQLNIKLMFQIDREDINDFFNNPNAITGNTKNLVINEQAENQLINAIKRKNAAKNPEFNRAKLYVGYQLGEGEIGGDWKIRTDFVKELAETTTDQSTNKVVYRLLIGEDQENEFSTPDQINILHNHENPTSGIKIRYFINANNWENNANKLTVSGTTSNLNWNFATAFGSGNFIERNNNVYLLNAAGEALQIFFTTNPNANYNNPPGFGNSNELNSKWISKRPQNLNAATTTLKVKLVALNTGFIYEPAEIFKTAAAHNVNLIIQREIIVDTNWLSQNQLSPNKIELSSFTQELNLIKSWENQIYQEIARTNGIDNQTARNVKIEYTFSNDPTKLTAEQLLQVIENARTNFNKPNLGIIQLWDQNQGEQIKANFVSAKPNEFILITQNNNTPSAADLQAIVDTRQIYTSISLKNYVDFIQKNKSKVVPTINGADGQIDSFNLPQLPGNQGSGFLNGYSFEEIMIRLNAVGVQAKFTQKISSNANWVFKDQVKFYDIQTSVLFLAFEVANDATNIRLQWSATESIGPGENMQSVDKAIALPLDVPKYILIDQNKSYWKTLAIDFDFNGNTKNLNFNDTKIQNFVQQILADNVKNSGDDSYNNAPLEIHFQVGDLEFVKIDELQDYLEKQTVDLTNRRICFKFVIPESQNDNWKLQAADDEYEVFAKDDPLLDKIKIFINDNGIFADLQKTKLSGSSQDLRWEFKDLNIDSNNGILNSTNRGVGLKVEFTFSETVSDNAPTGTIIDQEWVAKMPTTFNLNQKKVFLRLSLINESLYHYDNKNQRIELSLENILLILKLESAWLELIELNGNTKNLEINEAKAKLQLLQTLPNDQPNLVQLKYSIDGKNWFDSNQFQNLLNSNDGQKDNQNFILKRNEIKARFELDSANNDKFQMEIDNQVIESNETNNPSISLINDRNNLNAEVRGYIELKHLKYFVLENFAISGNNTEPNLIIKQKEFLESLMQIYASDQLFDILITSQQTPDGKWDFSNNISLLTKANQFISNQELVANGFILGAEKKVALKFKTKDPKYDVYKDGTKYDTGYDLDISQNVQAAFEIENPFTKNNKTLALWWTNDGDKTQAKYYQGEGGFKIVNGMANGDADVANFKAAKEWLESVQSGLSEKEKSVLEFVYYIYDGEPDQQIINEAQNTITNYENSKWKKVADALEENANNFTKSLDLKVGQYVSVALRVKEEYTKGTDIYTLKDDDYSFVKPIDGSKKPGRAHGYKVNVDELNIEENKITLENILNSEQAPLDGYTNIKNLSLVKDEKENYKGVDLELQLFHQFYKEQNQQDEVIITPFDKIKLIKRQPSNTAPNDYFKDADGNNIKDESNQPIPILLDANGLPTIPIEATNATFREKFTNYGQGFFGLSVPQNENNRKKWGIFKNESVKVVFNAYQGIGGTSDPDFILDHYKTIDLKEQISKQIKFPLFNQENIKYQFNHEEFARGNVQFEHATNPNNLSPIDGKSKVKTLIKLTKTSSTNLTDQIIFGASVEETVNNLKKELQDSFKGKIGFKTIYERKTGGTQITNDLDLYKLDQLQNNDRIKIQIVATDDNFIWAEPPKQLTIHVSGLTAKAPQRNKLRFLRVEQSGTINGKGAFKVLITDPTDSNSNAKNILEGWKFVIRVWNQEKQIKTNWTDDQNQITNLENGDKVEWKLLDEFGNPVSDAYYNTIAGNHTINSDGTTNFVFNQMNFPQGKESAKIVSKGIGTYPKTDNEYPENSGFVVSGLENELQALEIDETIFAKILAQLEPRYVGFNGQGSINFNEEYLKKNYYINQAGELYEKPLGLPTFKQQIAPENKEISLADFLANTTFYTSDPNLINYQNGFKFIGNDTNLNNHLSNGDQVWAQFDLKINNNEVNQGISTQLNPVSGLQELVTDPMTPLWYILMAIGGALTLGGLSLFMLWAKRNKKLKK